MKFNFKQNGKNITIAAMAFMLVAGFGLRVFANANLFQYEQAHRESVEEWHEAEYRKCITERELASKKLEEYAKGDLELTQDDLDRLTPKTKWECKPPKTVIEPEMQKIHVEAMNQVPDVEKKVEFDLDCLAVAVAQAETETGKKGYGPAPYNNHFGIKNGNTAPCSKTGTTRTCIYDDPQEGYDAFKTIWSKWYGEMPTSITANRWTGGNSVDDWMGNVESVYKVCVDQKQK